MGDETIEILPEQMKALARYETTFETYIRDSEMDDVRLFFPEKYRMTLDDLYAALINIREKNPAVSDFGKNWYYPLTKLTEAFCIDEAIGIADEDGQDDVSEDGETVHGLPLRDEDVFAEAWYELETIWSGEAVDVRLAGLPAFEGLTEDIALYYANRDKPLMEREFPEHSKQNFIGAFADKDRLSTATKTELQLCRKFTDELCGKGSAFALHLKGYACYGGNRLYECNWAVSRDCMIRLFELTDDPMYANTLGYIYYYGRCTGGVPEYDKAFEMFSIAAANGLHEGLYKLADMFRHGYACRQSNRTARALYGIVYEDCLKKFLEGASDGSFADAALRIGNVFRDGIREDKDPVNAYFYYLQAEYTAKLRAADSEFFGSATVAINARKALEEAKKELPDDYFKEYLTISLPRIFWEMVEDGYRAIVSFDPQSDGTVKVTVSRRPRNKRQKAQPVFLTYPEIDTCRLTTEAELTAYGLRTPFGDVSGISFQYDYVEWNDADCTIDFYYDEDRVCWAACDEYRIYPDKKEAPHGELLTLAGVAFQPGGRTYDYLCDIPGIQPGDKVIVAGYDGETEVEVVSVFARYESELGLPPERYKKVIRKA